jgi:uncharacterized membrane protein YfcA
MIAILQQQLHMLPAAGHLAFAAGVILLAYCIFGLAGFGSSILAVPFLIQVLPLHTVVCLMLLIDLVLCTVLNLRERRHVDLAELKRILPGMLAGALAGLLLLVQAPAKPLFLLLGIFVISVFLWNNVVNRKATRISTRLALPLGFGGGIFTTLFGTGGPLYTIYMTGRIDDKRALRSTLALVIGATTLIRLCMFAVTGLLSNPAVYRLALLALPLALAGCLLGSRLHDKVSSHGVKKVVWTILLIGGASAIFKGLS